MIEPQVVRVRFTRRRYACLSLSVLFGATLLAGCGNLISPNSPDLVYSDNAERARELQVPPDLTDVSDAEQFVLPGIGNAAVTRNTLLPQFSTIRFVREGEQAWLAFEQTPEDLWPQLLAFARKERYVIDQTEPSAGLIVSRWRAASVVERSNLLQNLIGADEEFTRIAFRLERDGAGTRLFARNQAANEEAVSAASDEEFSWPAQSHNPENISELLARFLVFLGVEEQKVRGIIGQEQVNAVLDNAVIQTNAAGNQLLLNYGFQSSFERVVSALQTLNYAVLSTDDGVGRIEFTGSEAEVEPSLVIAMSPQHVSAVILSITDSEGQRLQGSEERAVLEALLAQLG
jgi:uncharacterized lipoprotein